jgi:TusA-related sulfurtransferase
MNCLLSPIRGGGLNNAIASETDIYSPNCNLKISERRLIMPEEKVDRRLDLRGKVCPYPTLETSVTLKKMATGKVLEVITDYYPACQTISDLMREMGYPCKLIDGENPVFRFIIQKT